MPPQIARQSTPNIITDVFLADTSSTTGAGLTGLTFASSGLIIDVKRELDAAFTSYTAAGSTIETISTIGTYAAPTATKIRFAPIGNGIYQLMLPQSFGGTSDGSRFITGVIRGATNLAPTPFIIPLTAVNDQSATTFMTGVNGIAPPSNWNLMAIDGSGRVTVGAIVNGAIAAATFAANALDAVWSTTTRTLSAFSFSVTVGTNNDKTGYALSSAGVQAVWDALTSALTTVGSIGKMLVDKLNGVSGQVASQSEVTQIQNNTRTVLVVPEVIERPDAGTDTYLIHLYLYDEVGNMEAPDSAPTLALANAAGTDRSSRLGSTTGTLVSTGHYKWSYTNSVSDALEQLLWEFTVVEGGATRTFGRQTLIVDTSAVDFTASDRTNLTTALGVLQNATYGNAALQTMIDNCPTNAELTAALAAADDATLAAIGNLPTTSQITTAVFAKTIARLGGVSFETAVAVIAALAGAGKTTGAGTTDERFYDQLNALIVRVQNDGADRTVATIS